MQRGGGGIRLGARGHRDPRGAGRAGHRVARLGLREPGLGRDDARPREPVVEPRQHLTGGDRLTLVDQDLRDPALRLEREPDGVPGGLDPTRGDERRRPRGDQVIRGGGCRRTPEVQVEADGERQGEQEVTQLGHDELPWFVQSID